MAFIWRSPRESTCLSGSENICQAKIRTIGLELRVLNNVSKPFIFPWPVEFIKVYALLGFKKGGKI